MVSTHISHKCVQGYVHVIVVQNAKIIEYITCHGQIWMATDDRGNCSRRRQICPVCMIYCSVSLNTNSSRESDAYVDQGSLACSMLYSLRSIHFVNPNHQHHRLNTFKLHIPLTSFFKGYGGIWFTIQGTTAVVT